MQQSLICPPLHGEVFARQSDCVEEEDPEHRSLDTSIYLRDGVHTRAHMDRLLPNCAVLNYEASGEPGIAK